MPNTNVPAPGTPTQVAHPVQTIKRTLSQIVSGLVLVIAALALVSEVFGVYLGENIVAWVAGASVFLTAVVTFLTRLMALEQLQPFLEKIGLGTGVEKEDGPEPITGHEAYIADGDGLHRGEYFGR